nr:family 78 glycoside hydrolase catalytic domain [uncultured Mediterraneibacter sp.]
MLYIRDLRTEYLENPVGIDAEHPRFSWILESDRKNVRQESYHLEVAADLEFQEIIWDSGEVKSEQSIQVKYEGRELSSGERVYWRVRVSDGTDQAVSETAWLEMGLLKAEDWKAQWIEPDQSGINIEDYKPAIYLRRSFRINKTVKQARIYQTAHGLYEFTINGKKGTKDVFTPGFTSYYFRLQYQTYDITELVQQGENEWNVTLGDGWWRGVTGGLYRNNFGYYAQFLGQIVVEYEDGTKEVIGTDEAFETASGPITMNDMKFGEQYDARIEPENWKPVVLSKGEHLEKELLIPSRSVSCREKEVFVAKVFHDKEGSLVLDFGQNIAGYVHMILRNTKPGQVISLIHSEEMVDGVFSVGNICTDLADNTHYQQIDYTARGAEAEEYQPTFSVFGFQYVKVEGYDGPIEEGDFKAIAVYSDMEQTGDFKCSNPLINKLVENSRWSQKGNFLDVPTDCPTRERSAWTGDSQVYAKTASRFMNVYPFFEKWMLDVKAEQFPNGMVANSVPVTTGMHFAKEVHRLIDEDKCGFIVPGIIGDKEEWVPGAFDGSAGWGDTATITPYTMYLCYGDRQILENQYDTARRWVDYMIASAKEANENRLDEPEYNTYENGVRDADYLFDTKFHFGEWLEPFSEESGDPADQDLEAQKKRTDSVVATAYLYHSSRLVSEMAEILGRKEDTENYAAYAEEVKRVYNKYLIKEDGTIQENHQAPYVRCLQFGLCDEKKEELVQKKLVQAVRDNGMKLNTGFLSTPFLLPQLLKYGYKEEAFQVLEQTEAPGWLHPVLEGATTILEDWTGFENHINSFNHYSYGAVCDFLFGKVAGIEPMIEHPGYKEFTIQPVIGGSLTNAEAVYKSQYGIISSKWEKAGDKISFEFKVPVNTTAHITLPDGRKESVGSGTYTYEIVQ